MGGGQLSELAGSWGVAHTFKGAPIMNKNLGTFFSLLCMLTGCGAEPGASTGASGGTEEGSSLQLNLSTITASGTEYRLGPATFDILRSSEPFDTLSSDGSELSLRLAVPPDSYRVKLKTGWTLSRVDGEELTPVLATLTSLADQEAHVRPFKATPVTYAFHLGESSIDIGVTVEEGVPPGYDARLYPSSSGSGYSLEFQDGGGICCFASLAAAQAAFPNANIFFAAP